MNGKIPWITIHTSPEHGPEKSRALRPCAHSFSPRAKSYFPCFKISFAICCNSLNHRVWLVPSITALVAGHGYRRGQSNGDIFRTVEAHCRALCHGGRCGLAGTLLLSVTNTIVVLSSNNTVRCCNVCRTVQSLTCGIHRQVGCGTWRKGILTRPCPTPCRALELGGGPSNGLQGLGELSRMANVWPSSTKTGGPLLRAAQRGSLPDTEAGRTNRSSRLWETRKTERQVNRDSTVRYPRRWPSQIEETCEDCVETRSRTDEPRRSAEFWYPFWHQQDHKAPSWPRLPPSSSPEICGK